MQGEFRGDFTRDTYNPSKQFQRLFMQQGRVQLDADWNEQVSILLGYVQTLATDLIGPYGGPKDYCGFEIIPVTSPDIINGLPINDGEKEILRSQFEKFKNEEKTNFLIGPGHYYVYGKLCQNQQYTFYSQQSNSPFSSENKLDKNTSYLVYLDVWERHISFIEDANNLIPGIREVALGKADTATRSQLVWQVKVKPINPPDGEEDFIDKLKKDPNTLRRVLETEQQGEAIQKLKPGTGLLQARAKVPSGADASDPCAIAPDSRYRGSENQLYRVEIHDPGKTDTATFKWSRENGSVIFPVEEVNGDKITVSHLGWDDRFSLKPDDWVELVDDNYTLLGRAESLYQVNTIDPVEMVVTLKTNPTYRINKSAHPLLRRWDQQETNDRQLKGGVATVPTDRQWLELENGIEIQFPLNQEGQPAFYYTTGDYWLIPARVTTGDVEWPKIQQGSEGVPASVTPHGVEHYYAPLWIIAGEGGENRDCRCKFPSLCKLEEA